MYANTIAWTPDGRSLLFDTRQRTEIGQHARVDLTLRAPRIREDLFRDLYTWNTTLVDGSTLRLPRMRVRAADGTNMENAPRAVDVAVTRPLGEWQATGRDTPRDEAIRALLRRLGTIE